MIDFGLVLSTNLGGKVYLIFFSTMILSGAFLFAGIGLFFMLAMRIQEAKIEDMRTESTGTEEENKLIKRAEKTKKEIVFSGTVDLILIGLLFFISSVFLPFVAYARIPNMNKIMFVCVVLIAIIVYKTGALVSAVLRKT